MFNQFRDPVSRYFFLNNIRSKVNKSIEGVKLLNEKSYLSKFTGLIQISGQLFSDEHIRRYLVAHGFKYFNDNGGSSDNFTKSLLLSYLKENYKQKDFKFSYDSNSLTCTVFLDKETNEVIGMTERSGTLDESQEVFYKYSDFVDKAQEWLWSQGNYIKLYKSQKDRWNTSNILVPYNRIIDIDKMQYSKYRGKNIFLIGPSGSGKTLEADKIASLYNKVFYFHGSQLNTDDDYLYLIKITKPELVYIDDIVPDNMKLFKILDIIDKTKENNYNIVITFMSDKEHVEEGSCYIPGFRPGRIDYLIKLDYLTYEYKRDKLILLNLLTKQEIDYFLDKTKKWTHAYFNDFLKRLEEINLDNKHASGVSYELIELIYSLNLFVPTDDKGSMRGEINKGN